MLEVMRRSRLLLKALTAVYLLVIIFLAFVPGVSELRLAWFWPFLAFLPAGVMLTLLLGRRRWWVAVGFGLLGAAWVEAAQTVWMPPGYADFDDVLWASLGVACGVLIAVVVSAPRRTTVASHDSPRQMTQGGSRDIP
jgi:glycopeptide antibiotics resistance protein